MSEPRVIPREVQARIVEDLARGHRSISAIAGRHHVPADLVFALRDKYGPGLPALSEAARQLRKPASTPAAPVETETPPPLTAAEIAECRQWCKDHGVKVGANGPLSISARKTWLAARATNAPWAKPAVVQVVAAPAVAISETPAPEIGGEADPAPAPACDEVTVEVTQVTAEVTPSDPVENQEDEPQVDLEPAMDAPTPDAVELDDDVVDVDIVCYCGAGVDGSCPACDVAVEPEPSWCGECGEPLDELLECPPCAAARRADDWDRFYGECLQIPELAEECKDVADAVERLRDARAEHEHREGMVARVAQVIEELGNLGPDDIARAVLDLIEAAA